MVVRGGKQKDSRACRPLVWKRLLGLGKAFAEKGCVRVFRLLKVEKDETSCLNKKAVIIRHARFVLYSKMQANRQVHNTQSYSQAHHIV